MTGNNTVPLSTKNNPETEPSNSTLSYESLPTASTNEDVTKNKETELTLFDFVKLYEDTNKCIQYFWNIGLFAKKMN